MPDDAIDRARQIDFAAGFEMALAQTAQPELSYQSAWECYHHSAAFASQQAPEGWKLVPIAASDRMLSDGAFQIFVGQRITETDIASAKRVWRAMLDAAPSVTLGEVG